MALPLLPTVMAPDTVRPPVLEPCSMPLTFDPIGALRIVVPEPLPSVLILPATLSAPVENSRVFDELFSRLTLLRPVMPPVNVAPPTLLTHEVAGKLST